MLILPLLGVILEVIVFYYMKSVVYRNVVEEFDYLSTSTFKDIEPYNQNEAYQYFNHHFPNYLKEESVKSLKGTNFTQ